jgi:hypothetical protein
LQTISNKKTGSRVEVVGAVAQQVIDKYKADPFERMRIIYKRELRPMQWEWWFLMDENPDVVCIACPRVGKTVGITLKNLDEQICYPYEDFMYFAPRHDQAVNAFEPAYDTINDSEVLSAFVERNAAGKLELGKGFVKFINKSNTRCFGAGSNFEGYNATGLYVDELDDIPNDILKRMFGRAIGKNKSGLPTRKRLSGVIWGKLNLYEFDQKDESFFTLPKMGVYQALAAGFLSKKDVLHQRGRMTAEEWLRTMCLKYVESRNLIWEAWLHVSQMVGLMWNLTPVPPLDGATYSKKGSVSFGLDMGHQGGGADASEYSLQVVEMVGRYRRWVWGCTWAPDANPNDIIEDICKYWAYYQPDIGFGDALDANLIAQINEELYKRSLVYSNWQWAGKNQEEGWREWAKAGLLTPIHNLGRTKHYMYKSLRNAIYNATTLDSTAPSGDVFIFPMIDRSKCDKKLPSWLELQQTIRELGNLTTEQLPSGILRIERRNREFQDDQLGESGVIKLGDDRPDSLAMANHGLDYIESRYSTGTEVKMAYVRGF